MGLRKKRRKAVDLLIEKGFKGVSDDDLESLMVRLQMWAAKEWTPGYHTLSLVVHGDGALSKTETYEHQAFPVSVKH